MTDSNFEQSALTVLAHIFDVLDGEEGLEIDFQNGVLTIELEDGRTYLLNKHVPNREIWLSSPLSGAWHFKADGSLWVSTRAKDTNLHHLLTKELSGLMGRPIELP